MKGIKSRHGDVWVSDLSVDTRVHPVSGRDGAYTATIATEWKAFYVFGGMSSTLALRAAEAAAARPDFVPLSATATFCSPIQVGSVEADTQVLRAGKSVVNCRSVLRNADSEDIGVHMMATFGQRYESPIRVVDVAYPKEVAPPSSYPEVVYPEDWPMAQLPLYAHYEWRPAIGHAPWTRDWAPGEPRVAAWIRYRKPARLASGALDPVTYFLPSDLLMSAVHQALGPDHDPVFVSLEIAIQFFDTTQGPWMLQHCRAPYVANGYAYAQVELWGEERNLLAIATQRARALGAGRA